MVMGRKKDEDSLSSKPSQIRNRARRAAKRNDRKALNKEIERYEQHRKPIDEWDLEELARGRPRAVDGHFRGRVPAWITPSVQIEIRRHLYKKTHSKLAQNVERAVEVITELMDSQEVDEKGRPIVDARTRLAAAQYVLDHMLGKPTTVVEIDSTDQTRQMFAAAIVLDDGGVDSHLPVIEGEIVEEDEEE